MSNNKDVGKTRLQEFYTALLPYLAKWGHVIKNASGTGMNGRNALKFAGDTAVADDETNDQTVITPHELSNAEIADIMATLPLNPSSTYIPNTGFTPVGTVISIMSNHAPANYLACDGTVYNIAQYPVLAKHFKDEFGSENFFGGDGTTTFAVPDLRGEFLRGTGTNSHENQGSGVNVGAHQDGTQVSSTLQASGIYAIAVAQSENYDTIQSSITRNTAAKQTSDALGSLITVRPTNTSVLYCIAYQNIYIDAKQNYSTDEKVIGTWVDGKPIYQKTVNIDTYTTANISANTTFTISGLAADLSIDMVIDADFVSTARLKRPVSAWVGTTEPLNTNVNIQISIAVNYVSTSIRYLTIQYTKTTD